MKKLLFILYFIFFILHSSSAQDSCGLRISLLTCAPGEELYSTFGHTALRVIDSSNGTDAVFNYGTFEFSPDFEIKFIRGKLLYSLSVQEFNEFMYEYQTDHRNVQEQVLALSCDEKQKLFSALKINAQEENRYYKYDFLFDNCTTRAKDIVAKNTNVTVLFNPIFPKNIPTFRQLIHQYLDAGHEDWSKLGIDILLGAKLDRRPTNEQAMFLPDNLLSGFNNALINHHPLVSSAQTILPMPASAKTRSFFTPFVVFLLLMLVVIGISLSRKKWAVATLTVFDFLFFFILGLAGILLLFMWFGTDHAECGNNYNLLWALPCHLIMAFFVHSKKTWVKKYFRIIFWISLVTALLWCFLPQQMNNALLPILILIILRSRHLSKPRVYAA